jgi:CTP synthase (UTP-ammonia lyase)
VTPLACSLVGRDESVELLPGTRVARAYGSPAALESYWCSYGLSPKWELLLADGGLQVAARGPEGEARAVELDGHPFFAATLFLPQMHSAPSEPHPLLRAFADAAAGFD